MASEEDGKGKSLYDASTVKLMKIGVAIAVIRSKPRDKTAKEHADDLAASYSLSQQKWRDKCQKAQDEILHLKQQLMLTNSQVALNSQVSDEEGQTLSGQSLFPTPPPSLETASQLTQSHSSQSRVKDVTFLLSMSRLQKAGENTSGSQSIKDAGFSDVQKSTVEHSLTCVRNAVADSDTNFPACLLSQAITGVVSVLEETKPDNWAKRCHKTLQEVMDLVVQRFLSIDRFEQGEVLSARLLGLMQVFYKTKSLTIVKGSIDVFLQHVHDFCDHLRDSLQNASVSLCPVIAENMFDVLRTFELCINENQTVLSSREGHIVCSRAQERLEMSLLHLTEAFPLLSHAIWKITTVLTICLTSTS